jgi:hypothetical protein
MQQQTFVRLNRPEELKAHGLPWDTYSKAQWAFRRRHENGLADAFRRQGRNILVCPQRALELLQQQSAS